jgi:hypothetical protein
MIREVADFKVIVAYICVTNGSLIDTYLPRFCDTYRKFDPGFPSELVLVCNGGRLSEHRRARASGFPHEFYERGNDPGWDISAYQEMARTHSCDFLVCLGESVYFHRDGWLGRLVDSRLKNGPGMYGCFSSHHVRAHLNTTAFACEPYMLTAYPPVTNHRERYEFEHGNGCFWKRAAASGLRTILVAGDGDYGQGDWRNGPNILQRGDQSNCLVWANHTDRWRDANEETRRRHSAMSDAPFRL